ncbi:MAG TPA: 3-methyl-2-oxobutanoate hydroxymethyltransferase [bacterium]|nr:3-methyl-2-oxobutanoate hydroxymethyltransferase [bacterium]HPS30341.1 3-methyl-2-oxobutanoate hydroxymethyltransferase [bacterium]
MGKMTLPLLRKKKGHEKISMVTCYDASFAKLVEKSGVDSVLVGDSLGNVIKGESNTLGVSISEMEYHVKAVKKGIATPFFIADMPFGSYQISLEKGLRNAVKLMKAGAEAVKVEGGAEVAKLISKLTSFGIPVVGHVGLTPQYVNKFGGFGKRGKTPEDWSFILESAKIVEKAGAEMIVLEGIPDKLAEEITSILKIPTIGIGAGKSTDGQVLVLYDLLGMDSSFNPSFLKKYADLDEIITNALKAYGADVKK